VNGPQLRLFDWKPRRNGRAEVTARRPWSWEPSPLQDPVRARVPQDIVGASSWSEARRPGAVFRRGRPGRQGGWWLALCQVRLGGDERSAVGGNGFAGWTPIIRRTSLAAGRRAIAGQVRCCGGVSGLRGTGFHPGTTATKPTLQWNDADESGTIGTGEVSGLPA